MTRRRSFLLAASFALSVVLIVLLIKVGNINLRATFKQLQDVSGVAFAELVALTGVHVYLSNLKWRKIDASLRRSSDSAPSETTSFALTSAGVVLGQILPVQFSMSAARTLGTYFYGSPLKRGTAGTLFEQSFDVLIVGFLAVASALTWLFKGGSILWVVSAVIMMLLALLAAGPLIRVVRWLASLTSRKAGPRNRILRRLADFEQSGFFKIGLARQLMMLSAARFVIQVLMAAQVAEAVGAHIPVWHLAAAMPFVTIAYVLSITPGGLGVNELSYAFALNIFGTPVTVGAQWALENRILVVLSCFVVAGFGAAMLCIEKIVVPRVRDAM